MNLHRFITGITIFSVLFNAQCQNTEEHSAGNIPAFPGAEGFGAYAVGGRGGNVYTVTSLGDSGEGSLRYGIESAEGPRTIVFAVSGLIKLESDLVVDRDHLTIAGQTAPGDGICLKDGTLVIDADHVIIRYLRSRLGAESGREGDAISISGGHQIIIDHCSASWSVDECLSCSTGWKGRTDNVTVQWCIISESLNKSIHHKGAHGYGALIRGCYGAKYTYHHNLFAHNNNRNPRPGNYDYNNYQRDPEGLQFDFRNNVIYNYGGSYPGYDADKRSVCHYNYVSNYVIPGPDSRVPGGVYSASSKYFRGYYVGNWYNGSIPEDQWSLVGFGNDWTEADIQAYKMATPFPSGTIETETAPEAFKHVLSSVGASLSRDTVDKRVIEEVRQGTGHIIDNESEVGGWPEYRTYGIRKDSDTDGMPDDWEIKHGLDPNNPVDSAEDRNGDGYTNLEEYINGPECIRAIKY